MALCGVCEIECGEGAIKCSGKCGNSFHLHCLNSEADGKITRSTKDWKCSVCKNKPSAKSSVSSASSSSDILTKDFLVKVLEQFKKDVFAEMSSFRSEMVELSTSVKFLSDNVDSTNVLMQDVTKRLAELQKENQILRRENDELYKDVVDLRERMRSIEQYSRVNNIEISGLPVTKGENVIDLVTDVGKALGVEVQKTDFAAAHRVPSFRNDREPAVVVQFISRALKEQWITKSRQKRNLTSRDVNQHFPAGRVFVNDHLSPENKQFLARLKKRGRELGYTFIWCREGKFFARKNEGDPVKRINSYADLDNLK